MLLLPFSFGLTRGSHAFVQSPLWVWKPILEVVDNVTPLWRRSLCQTVLLIVDSSMWIHGHPSRRLYPVVIFNTWNEMLKVYGLISIGSSISLAVSLFDPSNALTTMWLLRMRSGLTFILSKVSYGQIFRADPPSINTPPKTYLKEITAICKGLRWPVPSTGMSLSVKEIMLLSRT